MGLYRLDAHGNVKDEGLQFSELVVCHRMEGKRMACRCQERRAAIRAAAQSKSLKQAGSATRFVIRTAAEDMARAMNLRRNGVKGTK